MQLQDYFTFIKLINSSEYLITDGGGPQQESYYLNKPCLLMRAHTERMGYPNVCLSKFSKEVVIEFMRNYGMYNHDVDFSKIDSPTKKILDHILKF
jgi:UDP-N-acetylglucosamine 2-epimerase (non-hydrolysing)